MSTLRLDLRELAAMLEAAEQFAHRHGFHETALAVNTAKNKSGWECVYLLNKEKAAKANADTNSARSP